MGYKEEITQDIAEVMTDLEVQPILFVGSGISQRKSSLFMSSSSDMPIQLITP